MLLQNPYDLLDGLDDKAKAVVIKLFSLAGQLGKMAGGYFYEKAASEVLERYGEVRLITETAMVVAVYRNFWELVRAIQQSTVSEYDQPLRWETDSTKEMSDKVYAIHRALQENLRHRGVKAAEEYELIASCLGGDTGRLDETALRSLIEPLLSH